LRFGSSSPAGGKLSSGSGTIDADTNDEAFRILVLAGVRFAAIRRVQEEPTTPRTRLAYIHLQNSFAERRIIDRVTATFRRVNEIHHAAAKKISKNVQPHSRFRANAT
jgi:hypothetical protein